MTELITTNDLIEGRMMETGLTKEQLLLVVAKSALVRHIATGPDSDRFVLKGGTLLAHVYGSPRESVRDADYTYVDPELPTVPDLVDMLTIDGQRGVLPRSGRSALEDRARHLRGQAHALQHRERGVRAHPPSARPRHLDDGAQR